MGDPSPPSYASLYPKLYMARSRRRRRPRRRTRKRKPKTRVSQKVVNFRRGNVNPGGGRPIKPHHRVYTCATADTWFCTGTTAGDHGYLNLLNYNTPLDMISGTFTGEGNRHPTEHEDVLSLGYGVARPMRCSLVVNVSTHATTPTKDFIFAWKFTTGTAFTPVYTAGSVTTELWHDVQQSKGWSYRRFSGNQTGGSVYPSAAPVLIHVPSLYKLTKALRTNFTTSNLGAYRMQSAIADAITAPEIDLFLLLMVFTLDGTALTAGDVVLDMRITQKVKLSMSINGVENVIDPGDVV